MLTEESSQVLEQVSIKMKEASVELKSIPAYVARQFEHPQYLLDFVGVGHDSMLSVEEGYDSQQIWLIARILEINESVLNVEQDLYGWARSKAHTAVLRRFPIKDFSQIRESQLLFYHRQILPKEQSLLTCRMWVDPGSIEHVWLHRETKSDVQLIRFPKGLSVDQEWISPRFRVSATMRQPGERNHHVSNFNEQVLLSRGDLFWVYFHKSPILVRYLLEGATKPVLPRFFQRLPKQIGQRYECKLNRCDSPAHLRAAINLANFLVSGGRADAYLRKTAQMLVGILFSEGRAFSEFPAFIPFTEPFMIEFLGRRVSTSEVKPDGIMNASVDGALINRQAIQAVQIVSIEPKHQVSHLHFSSEQKIDEKFSPNKNGQIDVPVSGFYGESILQKTFPWTPLPELALRTEVFGPPLPPASYNRLPEDHPKERLIENVNTPEDLIREARLLFNQKVDVPFKRIRPVLGQAPHYRYRYGKFRLLPSSSDGSREIRDDWLGCKVGFPINPVASALFSLVESTTVRVWTLADNWHPMRRLDPKVSLIEIPEWGGTRNLVQPYSSRQLCALIARLHIYDSDYYLFCVERRVPPHYNPLELGNLLVKPDEEIWLGQNVLLDILYTGVRAKNGGWPRTEELVEVAGCYSYPSRKKPKYREQLGEDLLHAINKLDF